MGYVAPGWKFYQCSKCRRIFKSKKRRGQFKIGCPHCGHENIVGTKYNAEKERCRLQHTHDSGIEAEYCAILQLRMKAGEISGFQYAREYKLKIGGEVFIHKPDFTILGPQVDPGLVVHVPVEVHEVKGFEKMEWRLKRALFRVLYPEIKYITLKKIRGKWISK